MSLFGRREKRDIADLKADKQRLADKVEELAGDLRTEAFNAKYKARQNERLADENERLQCQVAGLGRLLTRETVGAVADVAAAERRADRNRLAWKSARQRAAQARAEAASVRRALTQSTRDYLHLMDTGEVTAP